MDNVNTREWSKSNFSRKARYQNVTIHVQSRAKHVHENHEERPPNPQSPVRVQVAALTVNVAVSSIYKSKCALVTLVA